MTTVPQPPPLKLCNVFYIIIIEIFKFARVAARIERVCSIKAIVAAPCFIVHLDVHSLLMAIFGENIFNHLNP